MVIIDKELENMGKKMALLWIEVLFRHLPATAEKDLRRELQTGTIGINLEA
jgi:hypothetical protein